MKHRIFVNLQLTPFPARIYSCNTHKSITFAVMIGAIMIGAVLSRVRFWSAQFWTVGFSARSVDSKPFPHSRYPHSRYPHYPVPPHFSVLFNLTSIPIYISSIQNWAIHKLWAFNSVQTATWVYANIVPLSFVLSCRVFLDPLPVLPRFRSETTDDDNDAIQTDRERRERRADDTDSGCQQNSSVERAFC